MKFGLSTISDSINFLKSKGLEGVWSSVRYRMSGPGIGYHGWFKSLHETKPEEIEQQQQTLFKYRPKISIIVSIYETPEQFLREMIESVLNQTYQKFELCLVDGSKNDNARDIVFEYAEQDSRIQYEKLDGNPGISIAKNKALEMVTGDYIALLDHDDMLTVDALYQIVNALQEEKYEALYSDEDNVSTDGKRFANPTFKSDFNLELLRSYNYISRLFVVREDIAFSVKGFNKDFDGAQDYDFIFRCVEFSREFRKNSLFAGNDDGIKHIPRVLYHWRLNDKNTEVYAEKKEFAKEAGKRAVQAHLERSKCMAKVVNSDIWGRYKVTYDTPGNPKISIVMIGGKSRAVMRKALLPLFERTRFSNFEVIVVDTAVEDAMMQKFYEQIQKIRKNVKVVPSNGKYIMSQLRNYGASFATTDYILFLDGNTELIDNTSIGEMLGLCMQPETGIVSGILYNDNLGIHSSGLAVGLGNGATELYAGIKKGSFGYLMHNSLNCEYSAVLASCMMVKKEAFQKLGGFSDKFQSDLSDIDFCLRAREYGYRIVCAANAGWYYHQEGSDYPEREKRTQTELDLFDILWTSILTDGDPYYNKNFTRDGQPFTL